MPGVAEAFPRLATCEQELIESLKLRLYRDAKVPIDFASFGLAADSQAAMDDRYHRGLRLREELQEICRPVVAATLQRIAAAGRSATSGIACWSSWPR